MYSSRSSGKEMLGGARFCLWFLKVKPGRTGIVTLESLALNLTLGWCNDASSEALLSVARATTKSGFFKRNFWCQQVEYELRQGNKET